MAQIKLGELLLRANVLQEGQLKAALAEQQKWGGKLGELLVRMGFLTEDLLVRALAKQLNLPTVNLDPIQGLPPPVKAKIPAASARDMMVLPLQLRDEGRTLVVVMSDPLNVQLQDDLRAITKCRIIVNLAGRSAIERAYKRFYGVGEDLSSDAESSFKVVDSQGRTVFKGGEEVRAVQQAAEKRAQAAQAPTRPPVQEPSPAASRQGSPASGRQGSPAEVLRQVEEVQRKEVAALKAMVELLIERGVFTREEYLAKVKR
jgi:hypothetical protein